MNHTDIGDSEWRSSTRRLHQPGGSSNMSSVLGFGYNNKDEKSEENANHSNNISNKTNNTTHTNNNNTNNKNMNETRVENSNNDINNTNDTNEEKQMSDAAKVREFTYEAGQATPDKPHLAMNCNEVKFIGKMIIDEILELFSTVMKPEQAKYELKQMIDNAKSIPKMNVSNNEEYKLIAEQADAFVDIWYYSLNAACKKGINCSKIFEIVHNANMAKRDPITKKFLKREDGKIIKPKGWKPPNVENEIKKQMENGAWNDNDNDTHMQNKQNSQS